MGVIHNIGIDTFPKQSKHVGVRVNVCFHFNTEEIIKGEMIRDDLENPFETIIRLEDGRYVRAVECQYSFV